MAVTKVMIDSERGSYLDYNTIEAGKVNPLLPAINPVAIGFTPTATGNATNNNEIVTDPIGDIYFIDYGGDALLIEKQPASGALATTKAVTLTAHTNDFTDPDFDTVPGFAITTTNNFDLTGILAPLVDTSKIIFNVGVKDLKFKHENANSLAVNRFALPNGADYVLRYNGIVTIYYLTSTARWYLK